VDLPIAAEFAARAAVPQKAHHVLGGIVQKESDLMGKAMLLHQPAAEMGHQRPHAPAQRITRLLQNGPGFRFVQPAAQILRPADKDQRPRLALAQGHKDQTAGPQLHIIAAQLAVETGVLPVGYRDQTAGLDPQQSGGTVLDQLLLQRHIHGWDSFRLSWLVIANYFVKAFREAPRRETAREYRLALANYMDIIAEGISFVKDF